MISVPQKTCTRCKQAKSLDQFHKRALSPDGLRPICKMCVKAYQQNWRHDPRYAEQIRQKEAAKRPRYRERNSTYQATYRDRRRADPVRSEQRRSNARRYQNERYRNDPEYRHFRIVRSHRMRINPTREGYTRQEWEQLCARYDHRCLCCNEQKKLTADHVVPISRGGRNTIDNIQPLCLSCNDRKHTKTIDYRTNR